MVIDMAQNSKSEENNMTGLRQSEIKAIAGSVINEKFKDWKRIFVFFALAFLLVMVILVVINVFFIADLAKTLSDLSSMANNGQASAITIERDGLLGADYLAAVIPILLALGGSFIAFLGMNRLKIIDQICSEMMKEIDLKVKSEVSVDRTSFFDQILTNIRGIQEEFLGTTVSARNDLISQKEMCINEIVDKFEQFSQKYAWLEATVTHKEAELDFQTISDAHKLVEQLRNAKPDGYIRIVKKIVDRVCSIDDMSGDSADYHNLAAELARGSMYNEACRVLKQGEKKFKRDVDIHADIIEYSTKGGLDYAAESVQTLEATDSRIWTWRCYEFMCNYYRSIGELKKANLRGHPKSCVNLQGSVE